MIRAELYRHAKSKKNLNSNTVGGRSNDSPLITAGNAQSEQLGNHFIREGKVFTRAYTSPAVRARDTGLLAFQKSGIVLPIIEHLGLQEISQGEWEGHDRREPLILPNGSLEHYIHPYKRGLHGKMTGGESIAEVGLRMENALSELAAAEEDPDATIAIFTHDFALRCLRVRLTGDIDLIREGVEHCSRTVVEIGSGALSLTEFGTPQI
ncbi:MAG TPA: histidine phosphatase family protein [Candidatus Saccharimonadia bacterium]|nr:histidine phosphatase family protein [Candidatus Saccharimonadia bacterium]